MEVIEIDVEEIIISSPYTGYVCLDAGTYAMRGDEYLFPLGREGFLARDGSFISRGLVRSLSA